jgi:hypothetical protein
LRSLRFEWRNLYLRPVLHLGASGWLEPASVPQAGRTKFVLHKPLADRSMTLSYWGLSIWVSTRCFAQVFSEAVK